MVHPAAETPDTAPKVQIQLVEEHSAVVQAAERTCRTLVVAFPAVLVVATSEQNFPDYRIPAKGSDANLVDVYSIAGPDMGREQ